MRARRGRRAGHAPRRGGRGLAARCDLAVAAELDRFAAEVLALGAPDVIVHNAGVVARARLDATSDEAFRQLMDVNLTAPFRLTRALLPAMRKAKRGRIVFIGSISGTEGTAGLSAYCASKHAIVGLGRALAEELRDDGIQVAVINPGSVDTDMLKGSGFPPDMQPEDVARVALFLAAGAPAAITGASIDVFG